MLSRRDALKLATAAGIALPTLGLGPASANQVATPAAEPEPAIGPSLDAPIVVKWTYEPGSNPVIVDGVAYGSTIDSFAMALDAETGAEIWRSNLPTGYDKPVIASDMAYFSLVPGGLAALDTASGLESWRFDASKRVMPPLVTSDAVYAGVVEGALYALDPLTGTEQWRFNALQIQEHLSLQPQVAANTLFVTAGTPVLFALDTSTGQEKWSFRTDGYNISNPILDNGKIYVMDGTGIFAITQDTGEQLWHVPASTSPSTSPILVDGVIYGSSWDGPIYAIDAEQGTVIWELQSSENGYGADRFHVHNDVLVYHEATGGQMFPYYNLHGVNRITGERIWRTEDNWNTMYWGSGGNGTVAVSENHHKADGGDFPIYAIDMATGTEIWRTIQPGGFWYTPSIGAGNLYFTTEFGTIYCIGNLAPATLLNDVVLRGAPSPSAIERSSASAGDEITSVGTRDSRSGQEWIEVTIAGVTGWIPLDAIDPATLPPEGEVEYVYVP